MSSIFKKNHDIVLHSIKLTPNRIGSYMYLANKCDKFPNTFNDTIVKVRFVKIDKKNNRYTFKTENDDIIVVELDRNFSSYIVVQFNDDTNVKDANNNPLKLGGVGELSNILDYYIFKQIHNGKGDLPSLFFNFDSRFQDYCKKHYEDVITSKYDTYDEFVRNAKHYVSSYYFKKIHLLKSHMDCGFPEWSIGENGPYKIGSKKTTTSVSNDVFDCSEEKKTVVTKPKESLCDIFEQNDVKIYTPSYHKTVEQNTPRNVLVSNLEQQIGMLNCRINGTQKCFNIKPWFKQTENGKFKFCFKYLKHNIVIDLGNNNGSSFVVAGIDNVKKLFEAFLQEVKKGQYDEQLENIRKTTIENRAKTKAKI